MARGQFFAVGKGQWNQACELGIGPAATFLVMACGTGRDNSTTRWSAEAAHRYTGVAWRRCKDFIAQLDAAGLVTRTKVGKRPTYKLTVPESKEDLLWLPNTLVTGAGKETPPIARLRQGQDIDHLQAFVEMYGVHDLTADGGLPRTLVRSEYGEGTYICDLGQYRVIGWTHPTQSNCVPTGPLARFARSTKPKDGKWPVWTFLESVERMGLLRRAVYLAESGAHDSELVVALSGDEGALGVASAAQTVVDCLPGGYPHQAAAYDYTLPVLDHMRKATLVTIWRLTYRPHTAKTAAWYATHLETCRAFEECYRALAGRDFTKAAKAA